MSVKIIVPQSEFHKHVWVKLACGRALTELRRFVQFDLGMTLGILALFGGYVMTNLGLGESARHIDENQVHQYIISLSCYLLQ
jgi:hypothetical protein